MKNNLDIILLFIGSLFVLALLSTMGHANTGTNIYRRCTNCHNVNPTKPGSIGPDIAGSSLELITLKTQKREYPKGYKPKRKTRVMPQIKLTEDELQKLYTYINSFKNKGK